jgi:hypothetical protein
VFWFVGGTDPELYSQAKLAGKVGEIPTNHNPGFARQLDRGGRADDSDVDAIIRYGEVSRRIFS